MIVTVVTSWDATNEGSSLKKEEGEPTAGIDKPLRKYTSYFATLVLQVRCERRKSTRHIENMRFKRKNVFEYWRGILPKSNLAVQNWLKSPCHYPSMYTDFENRVELAQPQEKGLELRRDLATTACSQSAQQLLQPQQSASSSPEPHTSSHTACLSLNCLESFNEAHEDLLRLSGNENSDVVSSEKT